MRRRVGFTLIEIMVVAALIVGLLAVAVPTLRGIFDAEQTAAARNLALTYTYLRDEAALRNVSFRIAYNLDEASYAIEVGDPGTLIFTNPEDRAAFEEDLQDKLDRFTEREIEEGQAESLQEQQGRFAGLTDPALEGVVTLPPGSRFAWIYTPQYGEDPIEAPDEPEEAPEDQTIVYSYIFPNGTAEHAVIRIAELEDPDDGFTLEVEPLTGRTILHDDPVEISELMDWLPDDAPELTK